jgi:hypothetical protein
MSTCDGVERVLTIRTTVIRIIDKALNIPALSNPFLILKIRYTELITTKAAKK